MRRLLIGTALAATLIGDGVLEHAVKGLSRPLAAVYHLRMAGLSYEEMARLLELPLGTIKSRMSQLVERLQRELAPWIAP